MPVLGKQEFEKNLYSFSRYIYNKETKDSLSGTKPICTLPNSIPRRNIPMRILLSVSDFKQYENNKRGIVIPLKMSEKQFYSMLNLLGPCLEDHPHYHAQLQSDNRRYIYICFEMIGK